MSQKFLLFCLVALSFSIHSLCAMDTADAAKVKKLAEYAELQRLLIQGKNSEFEEKHAALMMQAIAQKDEPAKSILQRMKEFGSPSKDGVSLRELTKKFGTQQAQAAAIERVRIGIEREKLELKDSELKDLASKGIPPLFKPNSQKVGKQLFPSKFE